MLVVWLALAVLTFAVLHFVVAPYGRHSRTGWGPTVAARPAWVLMEAPSWAVLTLMLVLRTRPLSAPVLVLYALWMLHYLYRSLIYPWSLDRGAHRMPLLILVFGAAFNIVNAYLNGRYLFAFGRIYTTAWLSDARFVGGCALFAVGLAVNRWSDSLLRRQRAAAGGYYVVPRGGLYSRVSSPGYLGEILEWCGWALAAWSLPALSFALWTIANLAPRAEAHHRWYRTHFPDYPRSRRRLVPGIW
ncbi:MAG: 3-oxo-5-alpha-steroid 4-dehydrogenase [Chitinivibrionales bacterium]|nr:3-oxo-5-alpha-steroid 4-dehydrogenase [Chitinivibrionales bacterium]